MMSRRRWSPRAIGWWCACVISRSIAALTLPADLVPLSMTIAPAEGTAELAEMLRVPITGEGFFKEAQLKLRPMDFMREGIFLAGMAHYPKFIEESISHALAAAARALTLLSQGSLYLGGVVAVVDPQEVRRLSDVHAHLPVSTFHRSSSKKADRVWAASAARRTSIRRSARAAAPARANVLRMRFS